MPATLGEDTAAALRVVGDALGDGSVNVFDRDYRYVFAAGRGLANVGLSHEFLIGRTLTEVFGAQEAARVGPYYSRAFAGERITFDLPVAGRIFSLTAAPLSTTWPETIMVLVQDVTLQRAQTEEHHRRNTFVATVAHELRQPIGPLRTALELLKVERVRRRAERYTTLIERQVQLLERLVTDLGSFASFSTGLLDLNVRPLDLRDVLMDASNAILPGIASRQQTLGCAPSEPLPMIGDEVRLRQVFSNLLVNATNYTPEGGHIDVQCARDGDQAIVTVADSGRGISPELLPRIFGAFVRGEHGGMGIGLHVVRYLVEAHGGHVDASSSGSGTGSTFTVRLPLVSTG